MSPGLPCRVIKSLHGHFIACGLRPSSDIIAQLVVFTTAAAKQRDALPVVAQRAIENGLYLYALEGAGDVKRLSGRPGFRLRVGEYRVVFDEDASTIPAI